MAVKRDFLLALGHTKEAGVRPIQWSDTNKTTYMTR
jgi:hypothetical protein